MTTPVRPAPQVQRDRGDERSSGRIAVEDPAAPPTQPAFGVSAGAAGRSRVRPARAKATYTAITFDPLLPFEAWRALGARIGSHSSASSWWLGDWLAFGRMKYGRRFKDAIDITGLDYQTLRNYAVVARRFEPSRRRSELTFHHHAEVCSLPDPDQNRWLDLAAQNGWSKRELRRQIRGARGLAGAEAPLRSVLLTLDPERERLWDAAARCAASDLEGWIVTCVDAAARSALELRNK